MLSQYPQQCRCRVAWRCNPPTTRSFSEKCEKRPRNTPGVSIRCFGIRGGTTAFLVDGGCWLAYWLDVRKSHLLEIITKKRAEIDFFSLKIGMLMKQFNSKFCGSLYAHESYIMLSLITTIKKIKYKHLFQMPVYDRSRLVNARKEMEC